MINRDTKAKFLVTLNLHHIIWKFFLSRNKLRVPPREHGLKKIPKAICIANVDCNTVHYSAMKEPQALHDHPKNQKKKEKEKGIAH